MILGVVVDDNDVVMRGWFRGLMLNLSCVFYFSFDWVYGNLCDEEFFKEKKNWAFLFYFMKMMKDKWRWTLWKKKKKINKLGVGDTL